MLSFAVPSIFVSRINHVILNGSLALTCRQTRYASTSTPLGTQATYYAILNKTSDLLIAREIMNHIEDCHESDGTLFYQFNSCYIGQLHAHSRSLI